MVHVQGPFLGSDYRVSNDVGMIHIVYTQLQANDQHCEGGMERLSPLTDTRGMG